VPDKTIAPKKR